MSNYYLTSEIKNMSKIYSIPSTFNVIRDINIIRDQIIMFRETSPTYIGNRPFSIKIGNYEFRFFVNFQPTWSINNFIPNIIDLVSLVKSSQPKLYIMNSMDGIKPSIFNKSYVNNKSVIDPEGYAFYPDPTKPSVNTFYIKLKNRFTDNSYFEITDSNNNIQNIIKLGFKNL